MNRLASILAATDLSAPARHAADRAARLAHEVGAPLTLMHVLAGGPLHELTAWLGQQHAAVQRLQAEAGQQLDQLAAELGQARKAEVHTLCTQGLVLEAIAREAEARDAGLLVLGARGEGFLRRLVLGTTSERLLRHVRRPVLVVRQVPHERYRRVLVAVDFSPWTANALALARQVAPAAHLVLCHAWQVPFADKLRFAGVDEATVEHYRRKTRTEADARLRQVAQTAQLPSGCWEPCVVEGEASRRLVEQEQEHGCDLVVLGKHGQSPTEELLLGSVTKHLLAEGSADVLVSTRPDA